MKRFVRGLAVVAGIVLIHLVLAYLFIHMRINLSDLPPAQPAVVTLIDNSRDFPARDVKDRPVKDRPKVKAADRVDEGPQPVK